MKYTPRPYQKDTVNTLHDLYRKYQRLLLVSPTGSGKTVIAAIIIELVIKNSGKVLFLAHRKELITQCSKKLDEIGIDHGIIMGNHPRNKPQCPVQLASVQTLINRPKPEATFIIVDECHRSLAASYQTIINCYPDVDLLGLTATPWRGDGQGLGQLYDELYVVAQVQDLVNKGFLLAPTVYVPHEPNLNGLRIVGGDFLEKELDHVMNKHLLIKHMVDHWLEHASHRKTVVFACTVEHSKEIVKEFRKNNISAEHIDCNTDSYERDAILERLKSGKTKVISNVGILTEGWDLPSLSCVILARPTKSISLYLQMVGRGMRTNNGKIDTIVIDHAGCTFEHGLATDKREFDLIGNKPRKYIPKFCPNCMMVVNVKGRICSNCNCIVEVRSLNLTKEEIYADLFNICTPKCVRCNGTNIIKHKLGFIKTSPHKCKDCGEITFLMDIDTHYATDEEKLINYEKLLKFQRKNKLHLNWARFKYMEIHEEWPEKVIA
jgi:superfamily II DNA or RNA helicase